MRPTAGSGRSMTAPVAEVSDQINDSYLKANGQEDGVASYDRMVETDPYILQRKKDIYKTYRRDDRWRQEQDLP